MAWNGPLRRLDENRLCIPKEYKAGMRVDGVIYADAALVAGIKADQAPEQVANVATLPGIVGVALAMPDIHWGYGFPIGGVAAFRVSDGVVSPGGVGYDINCGVRLLRTNLEGADIGPEVVGRLVAAMYEAVPSGVGSQGRIRIGRQEVERVLTRGARWAVEQGYGGETDLEFTEDRGVLAAADLAGVSPRALERGMPQLGTLGAGNHFLEVEVVAEVFDAAAATVLGIRAGQVVVMIHTGSRGLGHQVCDDNVRTLGAVAHRYGIALADRQLACAPVDSPEGRRYFGAMACAANYAWANRQCITHWVREAFGRVLGRRPEALGMSLVYDVAHNIARFEEHDVAGKREKLCVHRKGATRALPPGDPTLPARYRALGQPVLIPGDMGTSSWLLLGTEAAARDTFASACHGAGRAWSRNRALAETANRDVAAELRAEGIQVMAASRDVLREEVPDAYKDVDRVVEVCHRSGIARKVARMRPVGVVKG
jgi:tRNA-splicing ligase RtcB